MFNHVQDIAWIGSNTIKLLQNEEINRVDNNCANNDTRNTSQTTNNNHCQVNDGVSGAKRGWCYRTQFCGVVNACNTREKRTSSKSEKLCPYQINARGRGCNLIFAHGYPSTPQARVT